MMHSFTQKYTIVHLLDEHPVGFEYAMENWPLHVTLADIFAINGEPGELLEALNMQLRPVNAVSSRVIGEDWFGVDKNIHVQLLEKTDRLVQLHELIVDVLEGFGVQFNNPQFSREGFVPHSTVIKESDTHVGDGIIIDSITLIDMFPNETPYKRRVLGTVRLK